MDELAGEYIDGAISAAAPREDETRRLERYAHGESTHFTGWRMSEYAEYRMWANSIDGVRNDAG